MDLSNNTWNQHYISQAEQRLNAIDPQLVGGGKRIHSFDVVDRDTPVLKMRSQKGDPIKRSLSFGDLFSFDVVDDDIRHNLEAFFQRFEQTVAPHTHRLIGKLQSENPHGMAVEVQELIVSKFMNFLRSPYSVVKALNTFGDASKYQPTDPDLKAALRRLTEGSKPHSGRVCARFRISHETYVKWLHMLFMCLCKRPGADKTVLETIISGVLRSSYTKMLVFAYSNPTVGDVCLLSDRGFNTPLPEAPGRFAFEFNLRADAFANLYFVDPANEVPPAQAERLRGRVNVTLLIDRIDHLVAYNRRTVWQCASAVFAAHSNPRLQR